MKENKANTIKMNIAKMKCDVFTEKYYRKSKPIKQTANSGITKKTENGVIYTEAYNLILEIQKILNSNKTYEKRREFTNTLGKRFWAIPKEDWDKLCIYNTNHKEYLKILLTIDSLVEHARIRDYAEPVLFSMMGRDWFDIDYIIPTNYRDKEKLIDKYFRSNMNESQLSDLREWIIDCAYKNNIEIPIGQIIELQDIANDGYRIAKTLYWDFENENKCLTNRGRETLIDWMRPHINMSNNEAYNIFWLENREAYKKFLPVDIAEKIKRAAHACM